MTAEQRRQEILTLLEQTDTPLSAAALAHRFSVSRQIVVGDVALLRAQGREIVATARGYVIPAPAGLVRRWPAATRRRRRARNSTRWSTAAAR